MAQRDEVGRPGLQRGPRGAAGRHRARRSPSTGCAGSPTGAWPRRRRPRTRLVSYHFGSRDALILEAAARAERRVARGHLLRDAAAPCGRLRPRAARSAPQREAHDHAFQFELALEARRRPDLGEAVRAGYEHYFEATRDALRALGHRSRRRRAGRLAAALRRDRRAHAPAVHLRGPGAHPRGASRSCSGCSASCRIAADQQLTPRAWHPCARNAPDRATARTVPPRSRSATIGTYSQGSALMTSDVLPGQRGVVRQREHGRDPDGMAATIGATTVAAPISPRRMKNAAIATDVATSSDMSPTAPKPVIAVARFRSGSRPAIAKPKTIAHRIAICVEARRRTASRSAGASGRAARA